MTTALVWLRRDLRLDDHAALSIALQNHARVIPVFVFDRTILDPLPRNDRRIPFILDCLRQLKTELQTAGSDVVIRYGDPREIIPQLACEFGAAAVHANRDYEPSALARDAAVSAALHQDGIDWFDHKDQVIFERDEVLTQAGTPFGVFTPYWRRWQSRFSPADAAEYPVEPFRRRLARLAPQPLPSAAEIGFDDQPSPVPAGMHGTAARFDDFARRIDRYHETRDLPALEGTSGLGPHLRFGTISVRKLVRLALDHDSEGARCWLKELGWREFYQQLLWHRPTLVAHAFRPEFDTLPFPNRQDWFAAWCEGQTGFPLVDAGMRELYQTGQMHNRLRMVAASFLIKDLLVDWRWGERHFARLLLDFELASNSGGWQWAASVGCDAQPWFRIFNPVSQSQRFDPDGDYIRRFCPELAGLSAQAIHAPWLASPQELGKAGIVLGRDYPLPIIDHAIQRKAALALFRQASGK